MTPSAIFHQGRRGNEIIASNQGASTKRFYHNDHLGGVNIISDFNGNQVQLTEYDPWSKVSRSEGNVDPVSIPKRGTLG